MIPWDVIIWGTLAWGLFWFLAFFMVTAIVSTGRELEKSYETKEEKTADVDNG